MQRGQGKRGSKLKKAKEIVTLQIEELKPYEKNPRKNEPAIEPVAESIKHFGFNNPVIINKDKVILAGHTRVEAMKLLGETEVPCVVVTDLTEDEERAFRIADNKTAELAEWDFDLLTEELLDCEIDMSLFGFDIEIDDEPAEVIEDDYTEEVEVRCSNGDIWKCGRHRLMCGDSTSPEAVEKLLGGC